MTDNLLVASFGIAEAVCSSGISGDEKVKLSRLNLVLKKIA